MTMTLDRPAPAAPEPPRRSRRSWIVLALLAAVIVVVFAVVTVVLPDRDSGGAGSGTSTSSAVSDAIAPERLQQLWAETKTPCANPIMASGAPLNKFGLIGDAYITSGDVADQLRGVKARGSEDFVRAKLERLFLALLQTQSGMVFNDNLGSDSIIEAGGDRTAEQEAVDMARRGIAGARDAFHSYAEHIYAELAAGAEIPDKYFDAMFQVSAVCR
jgi:hypothetical protein